MQGLGRLIVLILGALILVLGLGFFFQFPLFTNLWPWPESYLSYIFLASYAAAIGAAVLWLGISGSIGIARAGIIQITIAAIGSSIACFQFYLEGGETGVLGLALFFAVLSPIFLIVYGLIRPSLTQDTRPTPLLVRISFGIFIVVLASAGIALLLKNSTIFPWPLRPEISMIIGWIFIGAAAFFLYGMLRQGWQNASGQLVGFFAYDVVLIIPFLLHFANVEPGRVTSLLVYVGVLVYSGILSAYYLFLNKGTRGVFRASQQQGVVSSQGRGMWR